MLIDIFYRSYDGRDSFGFISTHRVNISCGKKLEYPEKTHELQESVA
jgi:hypothetical protein